MFSLLGVLVYLAVAALCLAAARHARQAPSRRARHRLARHWLGLAILFVLLAIWRGTGGEVWVQEWGRGLLHAQGAYGQRRGWQGPVGAFVLLAAGAWVAWLAIRNRSRIDPLVGWSRLGGLGLLGYTLLRLMSWHPVDALIYAGLGPFLVNHLIDMGLTLLCGICAALAARARFATRAGL